MVVKTVIHVGIAGAEKTWIPAFAGMTDHCPLAGRVAIAGDADSTVFQ